MAFENTARYGLTDADDWAALLPSGGHVIRTWTDAHDDTHTVALFHQLKCLDIIRQEYLGAQLKPLGKHCLNYLRQSVLCLADTRLESTPEPL